MNQRVCVRILFLMFSSCLFFVADGRPNYYNMALFWVDMTFLCFRVGIFTSDTIVLLMVQKSQTTTWNV